MLQLKVRPVKRRLLSQPLLIPAGRFFYIHPRFSAAIDRSSRIKLCGRARRLRRKYWTRHDIVHCPTDQDQQPEKSRSGEHPGQFVAVADLHEEENDQQSFAYSDRERDGIIYSAAKIDKCHRRPYRRDNEKSNETEETCSYGNNRLGFDKCRPSK